MARYGKFTREQMYYLLDMLGGLTIVKSMIEMHEKIFAPNDDRQDPMYGDVEDGQVQALLSMIIKAGGETAIDDLLANRRKMIIEEVITKPIVKEEILPKDHFRAFCRYAPIPPFTELQGERKPFVSVSEFWDSMKHALQTRKSRKVIDRTPRDRVFFLKLLERDSTYKEVEKWAKAHGYRVAILSEGLDFEVAVGNGLLRWYYVIGSFVMDGVFRFVPVFNSYSGGRHLGNSFWSDGRLGAGHYVLLVRE